MRRRRNWLLFLALLLPVSSSVSAQQAPASLAETSRRVLAAMRVSGDADRLAQATLTMREPIRRELSERDPALLAALLPVLDARFDPALIESTAGDVMAAGIDGTHVLAIEAWSSSPEMQKINRAVRDAVGGNPNRRERVDPARKALLVGLADDMLLPLGLTERQKSWEFISDALRVPSPKLPPVPAALRGSNKPTTSAFMVEWWLAAALESFDDAAIERFRAFAVTPAGKQYFEAYALSVSADWKQGWLVTTVGEFDAVVQGKAAAEANAPMTAGAPPPPPALLARVPGLPELPPMPELASVKTAELLDAADRILSGKGGGGYDLARAFLTEAERREKDDARLQLLWGKYELATRPGPRATTVGELRFVGLAPALVAPAEARLRRALDLDPTLGDAYFTLGRIAFHLGRDEQAAKFFADGRKHPHDKEWATLYETDLAMVGGDFARAVDGYRAMLESDNREVRLHGQSNLGFAYESAGRGADFAPVARAHLQKHRGSPDFRFALAFNLLSNGGDPDEALALIEPLRKDHAPVRQLLLRMSAEGVRAARGGDRDAAKRKILGMAQHYPGTPAILFDEL